MEPKRKMGAPKKPDDEKLVQKSIRFKQSILDKIDIYGLAWARSVLEKAKPPK